jgi:leucyl-tRNA synthetase
VAAGLSADELKDVALADETVTQFTDGKDIVKVIGVPDSLVNIVVR